MEKQLTEKNIAVLLWLKALHDFKEADFADSTFQEKLNAFESCNAFNHNNTAIFFSVNCFSILSYPPYCTLFFYYYNRSVHIFQCF